MGDPQIVRMHGQKISCLLITGDPLRFKWLRQSVASFCRQSYVNRELVICCDGPREYGHKLQAYISSMGDNRIRLEILERRLTRGAIRNVSVEQARGEFVCQWDDDDLCHPERLSTQFDAMSTTGKEISFFQDQLHYFCDSRELFWVNWRPDLIPGTLMCRRTILLDQPYSDDKDEEDVDIRNKYLNSEDACILRDRGYLYLYRYTGLNVRTRSHHEMITRFHNGEFARGRESIIRENLHHYGLRENELTIAC